MYICGVQKMCECPDLALESGPVKQEGFFSLRLSRNHAQKADLEDLSVNFEMYLTGNRHCGCYHIAGIHWAEGFTPSVIVAPRSSILPLITQADDIMQSHIRWIVVLLNDTSNALKWRTDDCYSTTASQIFCHSRFRRIWCVPACPYHVLCVIFTVGVC